MNTTAKEHRKALKRLAQIWMAPKTEAEMEVLLEDFLTPAEVTGFIERWKTVEGLLKGQTQRHVSTTTGVSISKVTRAAQVLKFGKGGFQLIWRRLSKNPSSS